MHFHPDRRNNSLESTAAMSRINTAKETLIKKAASNAWELNTTYICLRILNTPETEDCDLSILFTTGFGIHRENPNSTNSHWLHKYALSLIGVILDFIYFVFELIIVLFAIYIVVAFVGFVANSLLFIHNIFDEDRAKNPYKNFYEDHEKEDLKKILLSLLALVMIPIILIAPIVLAICAIIGRTLATASSAIESLQNFRFFKEEEVQSDSSETEYYSELLYLN